MTPPLHIKNASVWETGQHELQQRDVFVKNGRIVAEKPNHAREIDLEGYTLFPGLVNAHDHLELNHYPRTKFRDVYDNAHQWGEDVNARLNDEPFKTLCSYPLWDRLFIGGLKNLLCGATTVAHHGAPHKPMFRKDFPVRVLKKYGWAHSLHFSTDEDIQRSYHNTPKNVPWFIHLAEGTDDIAAKEYQRLKKLGCVGGNTVIVHGVGMTEEDVIDASRQIRGLVWCPSTNLYLLNAYVKHLRIWKNCHIALGSDSRLTSDGSLSDELRTARRTGGCDAGCIWEAQTVRPAKILGMPDVGNLDVDSKADILVNGDSPQNKTGLIVFNGIPQIGNPDLMAKFSRIQTVACMLDGIEKRMNVQLARQVHRCKLSEPGLMVDELPQGKRFWFF